MIRTVVAMLVLMLLWKRKHGASGVEGGVRGR